MDGVDARMDQTVPAKARGFELGSAGYVGGAETMSFAFCAMVAVLAMLLEDWTERA